MPDVTGELSEKDKQRIKFLKVQFYEGVISTGEALTRAIKIIGEDKIQEIIIYLFGEKVKETKTYLSGRGIQWQK